MSVKLREKKLRNRKISLYLDIYHNGKRSYDFLELYILKPAKTPKEKQDNKEIIELARTIRANKEIELQTSAYNHIPNFKQKISFIDFAKSIAEKKKENSKKAYSLVIKKIEAFNKSKDLRFEQINKHWCEKFYEFLLDNLSVNSAYDYFVKFSHFLNSAVRKEIINSNPAEKVERKKREDTHRTFLTIEEVERLAETPCKRPELKKAFLFSCFTGLRWSDVEVLVWGAIQHSKGLGYFIDHQQIKTQTYENLPVSEQAVSLLGEPGNSNEKVFKGIYYSTVVMNDLKLWVAKAGIDKEVTFHAARHTHATLLITYGNDISVVSKILGHKSLAPTMIYARIIDKTKRGAVDSIPTIKMNPVKKH